MRRVRQPGCFWGGVAVIVILVTAIAGMVVALTIHTSCTRLFDLNVAPTFFVTSDIFNGNFTVCQTDKMQLALRARIRFDENNNPTNIFPSNGNGTYSVMAGAPLGFPSTPNAMTTARWNFEWSINVFNGSIDDYDFKIGIDPSPALTPAYFFYDPVSTAQPTVWFGNATTGNTEGIQAGSLSEFTEIRAASSVAQQTANYQFYAPFSAFDFDANSPGYYFVSLDAFLKNTTTVVASTEITVLSFY